MRLTIYEEKIKHILIILVTFLFMISNYGVEAFSSIDGLFENVYCNNTDETCDTTELTLKTMMSPQ